jgi:hypothetical protein
VYAFFLTIIFVMTLGFINMFTLYGGPYGANWSIGIIVLPIVTGIVVGAGVRGLIALLRESNQERL